MHLIATAPAGVRSERLLGICIGGFGSGAVCDPCHPDNSSAPHLRLPQGSEPVYSNQQGAETARFHCAVTDLQQV